MQEQHEGRGAGRVTVTALVIGGIILFDILSLTLGWRWSTGDGEPSPCLPPRTIV